MKPGLTQTNNNQTIIVENKSFKFTAAKILLKNGMRKYGALLNDISSTTKNWKFVANHNIKAFNQSLNASFIEEIHEDSISSIDIYLK